MVKYTPCIFEYFFVLVEEGAEGLEVDVEDHDLELEEDLGGEGGVVWAWGEGALEAGLDEEEEVGVVEGRDEGLLDGGLGG